MDQFEYVMVLVSIIVGLGIAHVLLGIGGIVDRLSGKHDRLELSLAHALWLGYCFLWLVMFWWWEYELSTTVDDWTMGLYLFLISYAITLFLLQVVLIPRTWDGVTSLKEYFLERRVWFYGLLGSATILDTVDSYLIGGLQYILDTGYAGMGISIATIPAVIIGIRSASMRTHNIMATIFFGWQFLIGFGHLEALSS